MFTPVFNALLKEAQFTREMLGAGATQIRRANYTTKGIYFQAFTSLSTGLERIGKLCLILDHFIDTEGTFPPFKEMKHQIGHKLEVLYGRSQEVIKKRSIKLRFMSDLSGLEHQAILRVLHGFAEGDRYSNIDILVGASSSTDPVARWFDEVESLLHATRISQKKQEQIAQNAKFGAALLDAFSSVRHTSEKGEAIKDIEDASRRIGMWEAVAPYRQLAVLQVIRYWTDLVGELEYSAKAVSGQHIPSFREIFAMFYNEDSYLKSRKTWEKI